MDELILPPLLFDMPLQVSRNPKTLSTKLKIWSRKKLHSPEYEEIKHKEEEEPHKTIMVHSQNRK